MTLFCKDCRFYFVSYHGAHECHSPRNISPPDLVTGETHWKFSCERARSASQHCSKEALWFAPKPPSFWYLFWRAIWYGDNLK